MSERTLSALRNSFEGKVYIIIKGEELQKRFLRNPSMNWLRAEA